MLCSAAVLQFVCTLTSMSPSLDHTQGSCIEHAAWHGLAWKWGFILGARPTACPSCYSQELHAEAGGTCTSLRWAAYNLSTTCAF
jgi:hypothetical protein